MHGFISFTYDNQYQIKVLWQCIAPVLLTIITSSGTFFLMSAKLENLPGHVAIIGYRIELEKSI